MTTPSYLDAYENLTMTRDGNGVLTLRFHTGGGPIVFTGRTHEDFSRALEDIALDDGNRAMVLTGTLAAVDRRDDRRRHREGVGCGQRGGPPRARAGPRAGAGDPAGGEARPLPEASEADAQPAPAPPDRRGRSLRDALGGLTASDMAYQGAG